MVSSRAAVFQSLRDKILFSIEMESRMDSLLESLLPDPQEACHWEADQLDEFLSRLIVTLPIDCFRLFICDAAGVQMSSNVEMDEAGVRLLPEFRGRDWSFRPYFLENMLRISEYGRGIISRPYIDRRSHRKIRTFTKAMDDRRFIFVDFIVHSGRR